MFDVRALLAVLLGLVLYGYMPRVLSPWQGPGWAQVLLGGVAAPVQLEVLGCGIILEFLVALTECRTVRVGPFGTLLDIDQLAANHRVSVDLRGN